MDGSDDQMEAVWFGSCIECQGVIWWTGGWWIHEDHPEEEHDAEPDRTDWS